MIEPQGISNALEPAISEMPTGTVRWSSDTTKVSANKNAFHVPMKS